MGCGHDVRNAVCGGDAGHRDRGLQVGGTVVDAGQQMVVDIDHKQIEGTILGHKRVAASASL